MFLDDSATTELIVIPRPQEKDFQNYISILFKSEWLKQKRLNGSRQWYILQHMEFGKMK